jgi:5-methylcytosine-specific restriction endonuclease McrA
VLTTCDTIYGMRYCKFCNKELLKRSSKIYCSNKCQGASRRQEKNNLIQQNPNDISIGQRALRRYLIDIYGPKCMQCGWDKINIITGLCPIELEHIDGNSKNNNLNNLKLLCPNCHSLTSTYKALNKGNGRHKRKQRYQEGKSY